MHVDEGPFEQIVDAHYENLFRFAYSLARNECDASDLTQQTFYRWASKGHQLRDRGKVKTWLHTTLYREFLGNRRRAGRFSDEPIDATSPDLPTVEPRIAEQLDADLVREALLEVDELYRAPLMLFYLDDLSYQEIAKTLDIPPGTVMSRLSRGKAALRRCLAKRITRTEGDLSDRIAQPEFRRKISS